MQYIHEYAKSFNFKGHDEGCLLIHGFTASPGQMRLLGERLHKEGYTVYGILLRGHGTCIKDMEKTNWEHWLDDAKKAYQSLRQQCTKVHIIGLSMGGILSLLLAQQYPVDKIVSIAAPIRIYDKLAKFTPILKYFKRYNTWSKTISPDKEAQQYEVGYDGVPVKCVPSLLKLMKMAESNLGNVTCPALIVQSYRDKTVKSISAQIIYDGISSSEKEILWLNNSGHVCTLGPERDLIHEKIIDFLKA